MEKALNLNAYGVSELSSNEAGEIFGGRSVGYIIGYVLGMMVKAALIALAGSVIT